MREGRGEFRVKVETRHFSLPTEDFRERYIFPPFRGTSRKLWPIRQRYLQQTKQ